MRVNKKLGREISGYEARKINVKQRERDGKRRTREEDLIGSCCLNSRGTEQGLAVSNSFTGI